MSFNLRSHLVLPDPTPFLERLFAALAQDAIDVSTMELDHLCYRVATTEQYAAMKTLFGEEGSLLVESNVAERPIATYRLHRPFQFHDHRVDVVELPAPKPSSPYAEGYEHAEFVVREDLLAFTQRYPELAWDLGDLHKRVNADVRLRYVGFSVKFHRQALAEVIAQEQGAQE